MEQSKNITKFSVFYDAENSDLTEHKMNAYDLGNSILEIAKMVRQADQLVNKEKTLDLQVTTPAREGSFAIDFAATVLNSGAIDVLKYLGLSTASVSVLGGSALSVARRIRDERIIRLITESSSDRTTVELDGKTIECDKTVAKLVSDPIIRKAMNEVITQPLANKESPAFRIEVDDTEILRFDGEETQEFVPLPNKSLEHEETTSVVANVTLVQINFNSSNGWKMIYANEEKNVKMEDEAFMKRIQDNEQSFKKGDMIEVKLDIVYKATAKTERTQYIIRRVIRHRASKDRKLV